MRRLLTIVVAVLIGSLVGCGSGNPWDPVKVSGKISYDDGSVIPVGMRLYFMPQTPPVDAKTFPRQGAIDVNADGTFDHVTTYKYADGLIPGKHKVVIVASAGGARGAPSPKVPKECTSADTTPLIIDTANLPLEIKVPKPK